MKIAISNKKAKKIIIFALIYVIVLFAPLVINPLWGLIEFVSGKIDDLLNYTGIAMADGEYDPAGLWVIFGLPLLISFVIYFLGKYFLACKQGNVKG